jgi:predicted dienelactone hydrolase
MLSAICMLVAVPIGLANDNKIAPDTIKIAGLQVAVWIPHPGTPRPWPILIFSHGYYGCNTQLSFLMQEIAGAGYAIFAPAHRDMDCAEDVSVWSQHSQASFLISTNWSDTTYYDRDQDIERLLDALGKDPRYRKPQFDFKHVGLIGHSLGGYVVLGVAGAWPRWKDARVKAVLALSPYAVPFIRAKTLGGLGVPVMYQGGTLDFMTIFLKDIGDAYGQTSPPKYFVEFNSVDHRGWTDMGSHQHDEIVAYSIAFLDRYLKGKPFPEALLKLHEGVTDLKVEE